MADERPERSGAEGGTLTCFTWKEAWRTGNSEATARYRGYGVIGYSYHNDFSPFHNLSSFPAQADLNVPGHFSELFLLPPGY